jgi:hypothetical protein
MGVPFTDPLALVPRPGSIRQLLSVREVTIERHGGSPSVRSRPARCAYNYFVGGGVAKEDPPRFHTVNGRGRFNHQ